MASSVELGSGNDFFFSFASSNKFELCFLSIALKCPGIFWFVKVQGILASQIRKQTQFLKRQNILTDSSPKKVYKLQIIT